MFGRFVFLLDPNNGMWLRFLLSGSWISSLRESRVRGFPFTVAGTRARVWVSLIFFPGRLDKDFLGNHLCPQEEVVQRRRLQNICSNLALQRQALEAGTLGLVGRGSQAERGVLLLGTMQQELLDGSQVMTAEGQRVGPKLVRNVCSGCRRGGSSSSYEGLSCGFVYFSCGV